MSSTPFHWQDILDKAVADYISKTRVDPTKHEIVNRLQSCDSPDEVIKLLRDKAIQFKHYREENHKKLIGCLTPVVTVIHTFSNILGNAIGLVSLFDSSLAVLHFTTFLPGAVPTSRVDLRRRRCPPYGKRYFLTL